MAIDENLRQLRKIDRMLRAFAVDYANGTSIPDLMDRYGFQSEDGPRILARRLGFPRRYSTPPVRRPILTFRDLGIRADYLHHYLNK